MNTVTFSGRDVTLKLRHFYLSLRKISEEYSTLISASQSFEQLTKIVIQWKKTYATVV